MARRRARTEEPHADERWLITYADVLTLMFVLFMVLFSVSVVNTGKFDLLKETLHDSFRGGLPGAGTGVLPGSTAPPGAPDAALAPSIAPALPIVGGIDLGAAPPEQGLETAQLEAVRRAVEERAREAGVAGHVSASVDERGLTVRLQTDGILFTAGSAALTPAGGRVIDAIAGTLRERPNPIRVEGHTDPAPIRTGRFPSNWELSGARASSVVRRLDSDGIPAARLQFAGFGPHRPIAPNSTAEGRARNRRVEILVLRTQSRDGRPPAAPGGPTP